MAIMTNAAVVVLTSWSKGDILKRGASGDWGVSPERIMQNRYLVVTRNRHSDWGSDDYDHGSAFLVGRISGVIETDETTKDNRPRYAISFDAYAEIDIPNVWGKSRNPVWFTDLDTLGIGLDELNFVENESGKAVVLNTPTKSLDEGLSFIEAKRGVATRYGVPFDSIEILVRG